MKIKQPSNLENARRKFLDEMIEFYSKDPSNLRSVANPDAACNVYRGTPCYYRYPGDPNRRCAIGRFIPDSLYDEGFEGDGVAGAVFKTLPTEIQELGVDFLYAVQNLHDTNIHWCATGLSTEGLIVARSIYRSYSLGVIEGVTE